MMNFSVGIQKNIVLVALKRVSDNGVTTVQVHGTGFIIKANEKQFIVTCANVYQQMRNAENAKIVCGVLSLQSNESNHSKKYNLYDLEFIASHPEANRDICFLKIKELNSEVANYGFTRDDFFDLSKISMLNLAEEVYFMGYPLANEFLRMGLGVTAAVSKTIISSIKYSNLDNKIDFLIIDSLVNPGGTGSPVFEKSGKIIGIASGSFNHGHRIGDSFINVPVNLGLVRPANYIIDLLDSM